MSHTPPGAGSPRPNGEPLDDHGLPRDRLLPRTRISNVIDRFILRIGHMASWIWVALIIGIIANVTLRYVFGRATVWLEELQLYFYAIGFILGLSYALTYDRHVRVDALAERWSMRTRAWVELTGMLVLLLPFSVAILVEAVPYVLTSITLNEGSPSPGGLPYTWILKSFIIWGFALIFLAALSRTLRCTALLFGRPRAL
ncbi:TRAP transporter small permease subunit [Roseospira visakhapatnamensis]|uniref:TRAP transporter small permease protein n=1 Tax=Roseospira visakhapatnamensis TaxID=390880 RepID=A0A7W6WBM7_9PROT|nr:TRAP transporter small permease subunit [Roseospira visakhapatnamensis]MBB4267993.1 TRAP-type mannitol/chloroaromatic compound transport system permease small subunit [Roseospira visakhapatnamensis]